MPKNTIQVNIRDDKSVERPPSFYEPVLVYKADKIKIKGTDKFDHYVVTFYDYEKILQDLEKETGQDDDFNLEKAYLMESFVAFFASDDKGIRSFKLCIYKEEAGAKKIKDYIFQEMTYFCVFINTFKKDDSKGGDGLSIYKTDYKSMKVKGVFYVFATFETEIKEIFKAGQNESKERAIVFYSTGSQHIHLRFISVYLHDASIMHSVNPYGISFNNVDALLDNQTINKLRKINFNFYSLFNEESRERFFAIKEGVLLDGTPIDRKFTFDYLKHHIMRVLIKVWNQNYRQNSKLSEFQLTGQRTNVYTGAVELLLKEFLDNKLIADYRINKFQMEPSEQLKLILSVNIVYNGSVNSVLININTEDESSYIRRVMFGG